MSLHALSESGNAVGLQEALIAGADVTAFDSEGYAPLHYASAYNHPEAVALLLNYGADPNALSKQGFSSLHEAVRGHGIDTVKILLDAGADVDQTDLEQWTPLHIAALTENLDMCALLLDHGAQTEAKNSSGETPLQVAASKGCGSILQLLIHRGAKLYAEGQPSSAILNKLQLRDLKFEDGALPSYSNRTKDLSKQLKDLINSKNYSDIQFQLAENQICYAHKSLLIARSTYFRRLLAAEMQEGTPLTSTLLEYPNIKSTIFVCVLEYLYTGNIERLMAAVPRRPPKKVEPEKQKQQKPPAPLDTNFALELFDCSVKFELKTLQELTEMVIIVCSDLTRNFNLNDSAVQIILYYLLHPEVISPIFHSFCSHLLFKYFDNISQSPAYLNLPSPELATIIAKLPIEKNEKHVTETYKNKMQSPIKSKPTQRTKKLDGKNLQICKKIISSLMKDKNAWPFNAPVDSFKWNIPDYFEVIKHPMDFGTIKIYLDSDRYNSLTEFVADVRLVFQNAHSYNGKESDIGLMATGLKEMFEHKLSQRPFEKNSKSSNSGNATSNTGNGSSANSATPTSSRKASEKSEKSSESKSSNANNTSNAATSSTPTSSREKSKSNKRSEKKDEKGTLQLTIPGNVGSPNSASTSTSASSNSQNITIVHNNEPKKRKADQNKSNGTSPNKKAVKKESGATAATIAMSVEEKKRLGEKMNDLDGDQLLVAIEMIQNKTQIEEDSDTIDIDLNTVDDVTLRKLEKYIDQCIHDNRNSNRT